MDMPQVQRGITKWTLICTILLGGITYLMGAAQVTYGLFFGVFLAVINFRVITFILDFSLRKASPDIARVMSFVGYHVRFWLLVVILYYVILRTPFLFTVGIFLGLLLPKIILGVFVIAYADDEWWNKKFESEVIAATVSKKKGEDEGLRFPGLDFDDKYKCDEKLKGDNEFEDSDWGLKL